MRNRITIGLVASLVVLATSSSLHAADVSFGLLGGLTYSSLTEDELGLDLESTSGFHFGASVEVPLSELIRLDIRAQYVQKGAGIGTGNDLGLAGEVDADIEVDYISTPILLELKGGEEGGVRPYALGGVGLNWKTKAEIEVEFMGESETEDLDDEIEGFDLTLDVGAGLEVPVGGMQLFFEGLYSHGLTSISSDDDEDIKTRAFLLSAGIRF